MINKKYQMWLLYIFSFTVWVYWKIFYPICGGCTMILNSEGIQITSFSLLFLYVAIVNHF